MTGGPPCARCGGRTTPNQFGNGVCDAGSEARTCGHWWRRDNRCDWLYVAGFQPEPGTLLVCPNCGWDHGRFFSPTVTTPDGREHYYSAPGWAGGHSVLAVVRPRGVRTRRCREITLSTPVGSRHPRLEGRLNRLYGLLR